MSPTDAAPTLQAPFPPPVWNSRNIGTRHLLQVLPSRKLFPYLQAPPSPSPRCTVAASRTVEDEQMHRESPVRRILDVKRRRRPYRAPRWPDGHQMLPWPTGTRRSCLGPPATPSPGRWCSVAATGGQRCDEACRGQPNETRVALDTSCCRGDSAHSISSQMPGGSRVGFDRARSQRRYTRLFLSLTPGRMPARTTRG